jgi:fatty-acid desaturase
MTHGHERDYPAAIGLAIIHLGALGVFAPILFSWSGVFVGIALYVVTSLGISLGYHRLLTHRSLTMWKPLEYFAAFVGGLAFQGGPIDWVATHRAHHANSDRDGDPHDANRGMRWAHVEWIFRTNKNRIEPAEMQRWAADLMEDPFYRFLERCNPYIQIVLSLGLLLAGGWSWVIWGIFARLVFTYHCTWLVNSASHTLGYQTFRTDDHSTNNWWVALLTFGEGWHNNHHAFPASASHGLHWFELDVTFWMPILALDRLGNKRTPAIATDDRTSAAPHERSSRIRRLGRAIRINVHQRLFDQRHGIRDAVFGQDAFSERASFLPHRSITRDGADAIGKSRSAE